MCAEEKNIKTQLQIGNCVFLCVRIKFYADIDKNKRILTVIAFAEDRRAEAYHICSARKAKLPIAAHAHRKVGNIAVVFHSFLEKFPHAVAQRSKQLFIVRKGKHRHKAAHAQTLRLFQRFIRRIRFGKGIAAFAFFAADIYLN